jgi:ubiquinone/menaquinone biosynthesis C-methylase UbiE
MFFKSAHVYDLIYGSKDYKAEAAQIRDLVEKHSTSGGRELLDVACGTGIHLQHLAEHFDVTGLDLDAGLLELARERLPHATFHHADMRDFDLGKQFDAVTCLFSSIGYAGTEDALISAVDRLAHHAKPGGVVIVEPWFYPGQLSEHYVSTRHVDKGPQLQVVRMSRTTIAEHVSTLHFHYMVGTPQSIEYFAEEHHLTMYTQRQYLLAFELAGLHNITSEMPGITGRGLYLGTKPRT